MGEKWLETRSGKIVFPGRPDASVLHIGDIAHSLSLQCRYNGHCSKFYSVAEHSMILAAWIKEQYQCPELTLQALLHDAAEAYLGDIIRPIKGGILSGSIYNELDEKWTTLIMNWYWLNGKIHPSIKEGDLAMVRLEMNELFSSSCLDWDYKLNGVTVPYIDGQIVGLNPKKARKSYIQRLDVYYKDYQTVA